MSPSPPPLQLSNTIIKFAVLGLLISSYKSTYGKEVQKLAAKCEELKVKLNIAMTEEVIKDICGAH